MNIRLTVLAFIVAIAMGQVSTAQSTANQQVNMPAFAEKYNRTSLGENVFLFEPGMDMKEVQSVIDTIFLRQSERRSEFSKNRYAIMFKPGRYDLDIRVDYYMQILGLGNLPDDVVITGAVRSNTMHGNSVLTNFWRGVENLSVEPSVNSTMVWGVSQAAPMRRVHIKGDIQLFDKGYASGGFLADSKVDGTINSGPQQQWLTRNSDIGKWTGKKWNMMFIGVVGAPKEDFVKNSYTTIEATPVIREKPFLAWDKDRFSVKIPAIKLNSSGPGWLKGEQPERSVSLEEFYLANPFKDNSTTINAALKNGMNILFSPGRYFLNESLRVSKPGSVIMGIGLATLIPVNGNPVMEISDVDDIIVCGLTIDAGSTFSERLFQVGEPGSVKTHDKKPVFLSDLFFRVGGPAPGSAGACMVVNSRNVVIDHIWLWRADHGNGVGWDKNRCANGLIVNGENVTIYGLFNEHFQEYQTLWNANGGRVYFYQSEMPYDPPAVDSWKHDGIYGYASYKVAENVTDHEAWGLGIYNVFYDAPCIVDNAIEAPVSLEPRFHSMITFWLNGNKESIVKSIINGKGGAVHVNNRKALLK
jgi:hypothetical protein